jgi:predicted HAD superfamily phosphohydrolase
MTASVQRILESFERLPEDEKREVVLEILRRTPFFDLPDLSDEELVQSADELFLALDREEARNG